MYSTLFQEQQKMCAMYVCTPNVYSMCLPTQMCSFLPKSVIRIGSWRGISGRGRLFLDTLALLAFRGNLCFFCCKLLKWDAMCVFLWPDVRKILSQWGQGNGRTPSKHGKIQYFELVLWVNVKNYIYCMSQQTKLNIWHKKCHIVAIRKIKTHAHLHKIITMFLVWYVSTNALSKAANTSWSSLWMQMRAPSLH